MAIIGGIPYFQTNPHHSLMPGTIFFGQLPTNSFQEGCADSQELPAPQVLGHLALLGDFHWIPLHFPLKGNLRRECYIFGLGKARMGSRANLKILHSNLGVSINGGTPKSSIWIGFSLIINHPAIGVPPWLWKPPSKVMGFGWCLAACAGAANVIAFKSWNLYASHVTGSTSAMAFRLEGYHQGEYGSETKMWNKRKVLSLFCFFSILNF